MLGFVVSHVILTLFFFLVITPVGLVARLLGKDFLSLKLDRETQTYWIPRRPRPSQRRRPITRSSSNCYGHRLHR